MRYSTVMGSVHFLEMMLVVTVELTLLLTVVDLMTPDMKRKCGRYKQHVSKSIARHGDVVRKKLVFLHHLDIFLLSNILVRKKTWSFIATGFVWKKIRLEFHDGI